MSEQRTRTDDLTALADKYDMSSDDRIKLFKLYLSAYNPPEGYKLLPAEAHDNMLNAALGTERFGISASTWNSFKDKLRDQYHKMWRAAPVKPIKIDGE